ncbi:hypothetical protein Zmor_004458 [Zophobas morio]|uniref:Protein kinase domain-containing protein n=1 Tax=Zophobas morio TaxID=2755281 RepID=A0AA38LZF6_9CUCU|nr:hypothetical protein Zmor_004458 [Zophobas morio]
MGKSNVNVKLKGGKVLLGYKVGRTIGRGAFSKVKLAEHRGTRETVAVKIISKERLESSYRKRVEDLKKKKRREFEKTQRNTPRKVNNSSPTGYTKTTRRINSEALIATFPWNFRLLSSPRAYSHTCEKLGKDQKVQKLCDKHEAQPNTAVTSKSIRKKLDVDITEILPGHFSRRLSKEVRLLQVLEHPHIIRLYQVIETEQEYYIVTQYAPGGEMIDFIARKGKLPETQARYFFRQIISAVDHCHKSGILHRDLKLENILLSEKNEVLISDFGLGRTFKPENLCDTFCGTPLYASPELVSGVQYQGPPADVWAMGVVLFAMIAGRHPFRAKNMSQLYKKIREVDYKMPSCSESLKKLFKSIFVKSAEARATVDDLRLHEWVMEINDGKLSYSHHHCRVRYVNYLKTIARSILHQAKTDSTVKNFITNLKKFVTNEKEIDLLEWNAVAEKFECYRIIHTENSGYQLSICKESEALQEGAMNSKYGISLSPAIVYLIYKLSPKN